MINTFGGPATHRGINHDAATHLKEDHPLSPGRGAAQPPRWRCARQCTRQSESPCLMSQIAKAPRPAIAERLTTKYFLDGDTIFLSYRPHEVVSNWRTSSCRSLSLPLCIADWLRHEGPPAKVNYGKENEESVNSFRTSICTRLFRTFDPLLKIRGVKQLRVLSAPHSRAVGGGVPSAAPRVGGPGHRSASGPIPIRLASGEDVVDDDQDVCHGAPGHVSSHGGRRSADTAAANKCL